MPERGCRYDKTDLLAEMSRLQVKRAIVRHRACLDCGPAVGNEVLWSEAADEGALEKAWFVTPDGVEPDFDVAAAVEGKMAEGVRVFWTDAQSEAFSLRPWCSGPLYEVLQARRALLLLDNQKVSPDDLDVILSEFPELRVILCGAPRWGRNRMIYPLLRRHENLFLCLSNTYSAHCGYKDLCRTFGDQRWVFGMGYPVAEAGAAVTGLMYADLSDETKQKIAWGNLERLLSEVG